jgi:hypothetical protein
MANSLWQNPLRSIKRAVLTLAVVSLSAGMLAPSLRAGPYGTATTMTFDSPVEIPGQVLPPGRYLFRVLGIANANETTMTQIFDADQNRFVAMVPTVKAYRVHPHDEPVVRFEERTGNAPPAIHSWFDPGEYWGHEFVY